METNKLTADEVKSLYERHGSALVAYACSCGLDFASAEDVVQQVFLKMLRAWQSKPQIPLAYLYRATRNACLNLRRDRMRETDLPEGECSMADLARPLQETAVYQGRQPKTINWNRVLTMVRTRITPKRTKAIAEP